MDTKNNMMGRIFYLIFGVLIMIILQPFVLLITLIDYLQKKNNDLADKTYNKLDELTISPYMIDIQAIHELG